MTTTVTIGWWAIPAVVTIVSFSWAILTPVRPSGDYSVDLRPALRGIGALTASMFAWLVWALIF